MEKHEIGLIGESYLTGGELTIIISLHNIVCIVRSEENEIEGDN